MSLTSRTRRSPLRIAAAVLSALALHALALWLAVVLGELELGTARWSAVAPHGGVASRATSADTPIEIQTIVHEDGERDDQRARDLVEELSRPDPKPKDKAEEERAKEESDPHAKGQVVDIAQPVIEARPDEARFLAEYDSRVAHETRGAVGRDRAGARISMQGADRSRLGAERPEPKQEAPAGLPGPVPLRRAGGKEAAPPSTRARPGLLGQGGSAESIAPDGESPRAGLPGMPAPAPGARTHEGGSGGEAPVDRLGMGEEGAGKSGDKKLDASEEMLNRAIERGAGAPDWLRDVDDGESTALNAKKFKYATFFNRVKRAVAEEWHPEVVYIRHDPSGNVYGSKDRVTIVRVHLRPDGALQAVTMLESSGVPFLDDEAMDAFRRAAPFVNPPPLMVEGDGLIHFNFGFIFDLSGHGNVKVFRYR